MLRIDATALMFAFITLTFISPSSAVAKSYRWNCLYTLKVSPEGAVKEKFQMEFAFDDITRKAVLIGNLGIADVEIHVGPSGVTFIERLAIGVVQTTTVANDGSSVHSRHTIIDKLFPSQYYGQCKS